MKLKKLLLLMGICTLFLGTVVMAATEVYTVQKGDSLWKIAVRYKMGVSEIINSNPQFKDPNMIYPGDKVTVPLPDPKLTSTENEVLRLVNIERSKAGLSPLELDWQVSRVAQYKSEDMKAKNYFSHTSPTYGSPFEMLKSFGVSYSYAGENIAKGQKTPEAVVTAWMNSEGHRANILNKNFTKLGVGFVEGNGTTYWTQLFTRP